MRSLSYSLIALVAGTAIGCRSSVELSGSDVLRDAPIAANAPSLYEAAVDQELATMLAPLPSASEGEQLRQVDYQADDAPLLAQPGETIPSPLPAPQNGLPHNESSRVTLAELESLALSNNPALAVASARITAANGNWLQVGLKPNPVVGYSGQQLGSGGEATQNGIYLGQEFVTGNKLHLNRERASWDVQQAKRQYDTTRLRVLTDVRIRYYETLIAQRREQLANELVTVGVKGVEAADALFRGGEVSQADPLRAKIEADTANILLRVARNQHAEAWRRLTAVLGMPSFAPQPLAGELSVDQIELTWQETLDRVLAESPELEAAQAEVQSARWALQRAHAEVIPNVSVDAVIQDDRGTESVNGNLQVSLPLPLWDRNQGGIQQAHSEAIAAQRAVDQLSLELRARMATAFEQYQSARNQVEVYAQPGGMIEKADRTLELIRKGYQADEFSVLDLLAAQRTYFETNLAYLESQREMWVAVTQIQGLLLRDSLSQP